MPIISYQTRKKNSFIHSKFNLLVMLAMAEGLSHDVSWEGEKSWSFLNLLEGDQENGASKKLEINANKENGEKDDKKELAQPDLPPSATTDGKGKKRAAVQKGSVGGGGESDHELHIWTERERRKKMRNMFTSLHALLPHLPPRADKSTIVDEAVVYIKKLQQDVQQLEKQKLEKFNGIISSCSSVISQQRLVIPSIDIALSNPNSIIASPQFSATGHEFPAMFKTWTSANVVLNVAGREAHISICGPKKARLLTSICYVMEKYKMEVVSAHVSSDRNRCMFMIHTNIANGGSDVFQQAFPVEEIYKQAAEEMMMWVNS